MATKEIKRMIMVMVNDYGYLPPPYPVLWDIAFINRPVPTTCDGVPPNGSFEKEERE